MCIVKIKLLNQFKISFYRTSFWRNFNIESQQINLCVNFLMILLISAGFPYKNDGGASSGPSTVVGPESYDCPTCGKRYSNQYCLKRHIRYECEVEPKFECVLCKRRSKHKFNLLAHLRKMHNVENPAIFLNENDT